MNGFVSYLEQNLLNDNFDNNTKVIITGDMNIKYLDNTNLYDRLSFNYFTLFLEFGFKFLISKPTRFDVNGQCTVIDHTWSNLGNEIMSCVINSPVSDHLPTFSQFEIIPASEFTLKRNRDFSQKNIDKYVNDKTQIFSQFRPVNPIDINSTIDKIMTHFPKAINKYFPIRKQQITRKRYKAPWLTRNIIKCINKSHYFFKLFKRKRITYELYKNFSKLVDKLVDVARSIYFSDTFNKNVGNSKLLWKNIKRLKGEDSRVPIHNILHNGQTIVDKKEIGGHLMENFKGVPIELRSKLATPQAVYDVTINERSIFLRPTDISEVINIINSLETKDNLGPIPLRVIKLSLFEMAEIICLIFNAMIIEGTYPDKLKLARLVPIFKGGSRKDVKNYRPISILPILDKIFEKLLYNRLVYFFEYCNIISENQFGFRKNKNTEQAVLKLFDNISPTFYKGGYSLCIMADLTRAFDTVDTTVLMNKLYAYGIRGVAHNLIRSFLTNRQQCINLPNGIEADPVPCIMGVPQGACLAPLLFAIYINDVCEVLGDCDIVLYADDIAIHQHNYSLNQLETNMNNAMNKFNDYCLFNYLTVNNSKTKFMVFSSEKIEVPPVIRSNNNTIEFVRTFKYLGIFIDDDLRHSSHLNSLIVFMKQQIGILNCISKYFSYCAARTYYYAYIYSKLNYGINAWGGVLLADSCSNRLKKLQNRVIKLLFGKFIYHLHSEELYLPLQFLKLDQIYKYNLMIAMYKISKENQVPFLYKNLEKYTFKHEYNTRSNILRVPICKTRNEYFNFIYRAILTFNETPNKIKEIDNFTTFKRELKLDYLNSYHC